VATHTVQVWMVFVLAALLGLVTVVDNPTRQTFIMEIVGRDRLPNAVTLNATMVNLARVVGPTIAGALIAGAGLAWCFFINAASYVAVLLCMYLMDGSKLAPTKQTTRMRGQLTQGFSYIWGNPVLRNTLAMAAVIGMFTYEFPVVLPLYASRTFGSGAGTYALFMAMMSIGAVVGGVMTAGSRRLTQPAVAIAAVIFGGSIALAAAAPSSVAAAALLIGVGAGSILFVATANSILQLHARPEMRGRVMALWSVAFLGTTPIGGPLIGWIADAGGPRLALLVGAAAAIIAGAIGLAYLRTHKPTGANMTTTRDPGPF